MGLASNPVLAGSKAELPASQASERACTSARFGTAPAIAAALASTPGDQAPLFECQSHAQRHNGRYDEALRTARTLVARCQVSDMPRTEDCQGQGFVAQALAEVELGRPREALAAVRKRRDIPHNQIIRFPDLATAYGRALLDDGRPQEALEPLRLAYGRFLSRFPGDAQAAEAEYGLARACLAVGDKRGHWMLAEAKRALAASPIRSHRVLAVRPGP